MLTQDQRWSDSVSYFFPFFSFPTPQDYSIGSITFFHCNYKRHLTLRCSLFNMHTINRRLSVKAEGNVVVRYQHLGEEDSCMEEIKAKQRVSTWCSNLKAVCQQQLFLVLQGTAQDLKEEWAPYCTMLLSFELSCSKGPLKRVCPDHCPVRHSQGQ